MCRAIEQHTHLPQEFLHMAVEVLIRELELFDDTVGFIGESHGYWW